MMLLSLLSGLHDDQEPPSAPEVEVEQDLFLVSSPPALRDLIRTPPEGTRILLYLYLAENGLAQGEELVDEPPSLQPQPVASWAMPGPGARFDAANEMLQLGQPDASFPVDPGALQGRFLAQVVVDLPGNESGPGAPGDVIGPVIEIELDSEVRDITTLELNRVRQRSPEQPPFKNCTAVRRPTELIPRQHGEIAVQNAWVVLPRDYDDLRAKRRFWPTIYVIPEFEPAEMVAARLAKLSRQRELNLILPKAIWVVLDPIGLYGHHYFEDSPLNGARRRALIEELIPWLDVRFRTIAEPDARLLMGEGAGGRAALGMLTGHPDTFGRAWAIAPDAVSFSHLGLLDLYRGENAFTDEQGLDWPARRSPLGSERELIHATVRDEIERARVLGVQGRSGTIWDARRAAFGVPRTNEPFPPWPFDPETGKIDPLTSVDWSERDLLLRAQRDPAIAECLRKQARIIVGGRDERYREEGVAALATLLGVDSELQESPVHIKPETTNETISPLGRVRAYEEIIEYLRTRELMD